MAGTHSIKEEAKANIIFTAFTDIGYCIIFGSANLIMTPFSSFMSVFEDDVQGTA